MNDGPGTAFPGSHRLTPAGLGCPNSAHSKVFRIGLDQLLGVTSQILQYLPEKRVSLVTRDLGATCGRVSSVIYGGGLGHVVSV